MNTSQKADWSNLTTRELQLAAAILELLIAIELRKRIDSVRRPELAPARISPN